VKPVSLVDSLGEIPLEIGTPVRFNPGAFISNSTGCGLFQIA
jgi:hypothetical protein